MTAVYECVCGATGSAVNPHKTDAASPAAKHVKACGRVLLTSVQPDALARMVARVREAA